MPRPHITNNSGNYEWYTPTEIIEAARTVMGIIDLDPASSHTANQTVRARRFFSIADDGLQHPWTGNIWLNPPYARGLINLFADKYYREVTNRNIDQAIVLVNNATETKWFTTIASASDAIHFPSSRIRFWYPGRPSKTPIQGQAIFYKGSRVARFFNAFPDGISCRFMTK